MSADATKMTADASPFGDVTKLADGVGVSASGTGTGTLPTGTPTAVNCAASAGFTYMKTSLILFYLSFYVYTTLRGCIMSRLPLMRLNTPTTLLRTFERSLCNPLDSPLSENSIIMNAIELINPSKKGVFNPNE